jgi:hypothetical protein
MDEKSSIEVIDISNKARIISVWSVVITIFIGYLLESQTK